MFKNDIGLLILRVFSGLTMMSHGWPKLVGFAEKSSSFPDPLGIGSLLSLSGTVATEFFFALFVVLGIGTRLFSAGICFTMLIAAFVVHGADPFQKKELASIYAVIFLALVFTGGGKFGLSRFVPNFKKYS